MTVNFGGTTFDNWRLPSTVDGPWVFGYNGTTTAGFNITSSEMGHLYYTELGNKAYYDTLGNPQTGWGLSNKGLFINLQPDRYWSGISTGCNADPGSAWGFRFYDGNQFCDSKSYVSNDDLAYALAVRPGDFTLVPEPISYILFVTGGTLFAGRSYLKRNKKT